MKEYHLSLKEAKQMTVAEVVAKAFDMSKAEAKRIIKQGGVTIWTIALHSEV